MWSAKVFQNVLETDLFGNCLLCVVKELSMVIWISVIDCSLTDFVCEMCFLTWANASFNWPNLSLIWLTRSCICASLDSRDDYSCEFFINIFVSCTGHLWYWLPTNDLLWYVWGVILCFVSVGSWSKCLFCPFYLWSSIFFFFSSSPQCLSLSPFLSLKTKHPCSVWSFSTYYCACCHFALYVLTVFLTQSDVYLPVLLFPRQ